ncbi:MAG TPA: sugar phosphate isomerase/epimerase [Clostridiaceae bacterium]|nr:sugar phosphate isomerase/epimerase [Clostridiaceae bacterium]
MKLAANTYCYRALDRESVFRSMAGLGLKGVEIITHDPCYHVDTLDTVEIREKTLKLLDELGLEIVAISPHTEFLVFDKRERRQQIEHSMAQIDLAELYGVKLVRIFSGGKVPEGRTWRECVDAVLEGLKPCVEYAEKRGMRLAVESHGQFGNDLEAMLTILDEINSPMFGVTLDTANFTYYNVDVIEAIEKINKRIYHTHLKDCCISSEKRYGTAVGEGDLDFHAILKKLIEVGYSGAYCIEYEGKSTPEEGFRRSIEYLNKLGSELGL